MRLFGRFVLGFLAIVGALAVLTVGIGIWGAMKARPPALPNQMVLMLDINGAVAETDDANPFAMLSGESLATLRDMVLTLEQAGNDPRVKAVVVRLDSVQLGMAQTQELRDAILAFRKNGKTAIAWASSFGEAGSGTLAYYAASAFDEIWMQPSGDLGLTGYAIEAPFFKDTMAMLGVKAEFGSRWEYKSAIETMTQTHFSPEAKESFQLLISSWTDQTIKAIAKERNLTEKEVKALIDRAPLLGEEAHKAGLIDLLAYWDELQSMTESSGWEEVDFFEYAASINNIAVSDKARVIAVIDGVGEVQTRDAGPSAFGGGAVFSSDRVTQAFRDAIADENVEAILFRIDSPGGSYSASDAVWREVGNARRVGKPVVVSMGDLAASGGYFAAMGADKIVAQPGTITGSIGVFSGKLVLKDLWSKIGVSWDGVKAGANADIWSENTPFTPQGWERMNAILDSIYADFTSKAGRDRKLDSDQIDKVARGRIWPGLQAKDVGLVDELGGYSKAIGILRELAHIGEKEPLHLQVFPKPQEPYEYVMSLLRTGHLGASFAALAKLNDLVEIIEPALTASTSGALRMPPVETK